MWRASPSTTVSVTVTSGCSDVPDFSAYFRAYAHILSMLGCDGLAGSLTPPRRWCCQSLHEPRRDLPVGERSDEARAVDHADASASTSAIPERRRVVTPVREKESRAGERRRRVLDLLEGLEHVFDEP